MTEASSSAMQHNDNDGESNPYPAHWGPTAWALLADLRQRCPLVQCLTNFVSMDMAANTLIAAGASPAMIHSLGEIPDFTPQTHALCVNVGTLSPSWVPAMKAAAELMIKLGKPWVLDPVSAGASGFRLNTCLALVGLKPTVIRGNGSEIIALSKASLGASKGVESAHGSSMDALEAAKSLAKSSGSVVAVSGAVDIVTDGNRVVGVHNGVPMMQKIAATGCAVTAFIAAFVALDPSHPLEATASALSVFGIAGELGMVLAKGPASLRVHLIDSLTALDEAALLSRVRITDM
ncbi:unnamed protein product [Linum trigynum]|uniref:Hydroxyethylthiazole kinase n=1 Tax=Linum trigynum TaxID=586398 RepID=A0AAV2CHP9_9ROSI